MEAVIDPSGPTVVGTVPPHANLMGPWTGFITLPVPDGLEGKPLKADLVDDVWVISLDVDTVTTQAWTALRTERNRRLAASDWTALSDAHLSQDKKDAWFTYRQSLRDLPENATDPTQVTWPVSPSQ